MSFPVHVIGMGAEGWKGLSPASQRVVASATHLAGGRRHLALIGETKAETLTITNDVEGLVARLRQRAPEERWVVLASGDPLFYGVGRALCAGLSPAELVFEPAVSSVQLAFARAGLPWQEARIASIHGRPLARVLLPLLGEPTVALFSQDHSSPAAVAQFLLDRGLDDYEAWVAENLGAPNERVIYCKVHDLLNQRFADLNILILRRRDAPAPIVPRQDPPGIPDHLFAQPAQGPVLLTHAEIRAVVLSRFRGLPEGPIWDIGAGLGGVAIELSRAFPEREVVAIERSNVTLDHLLANRQRFACYNLRIVQGEAPEALEKETPPAAVFLGGSGGRLGAILELCQARMVEGACLVATFVGLENLSQCIEHSKAAGWNAEVTLMQISHAQPLASLTALAPLRPVWVVRAQSLEDQRTQQRSQSEHEQQQADRAQQGRER